MTQRDTRRTLATVDRAVALVDTIKEMEGATITELVEEMGLAKSTVHSYVSTLELNHYLVREGNQYHVGMKFLQLGGYASNRKDGYKFAMQKVKKLAKETGERAQFIVEEHGRGTYLYTETEDSAVQIDARIGKVTPLHASAAGKAILAHLSEERVDEIVDQWGLPKVTKNTILDREDLNEELTEVRDRGYSFNREESVMGLRAVGVPVMDLNDDVLGALSVSAPSNRMQGDWFTEEIPLLLLGASNEIELNIAYS